MHSITAYARWVRVILGLALVYVVAYAGLRASGVLTRTGVFYNVAQSSGGESETTRPRGGLDGATHLGATRHDGTCSRHAPDRPVVRPDRVCGDAIPRIVRRVAVGTHTLLPVPATGAVGSVGRSLHSHRAVGRRLDRAAVDDETDTPRRALVPGVRL